MEILLRKGGFSMQHYLAITDIYAREIIDSRGNPTIEVEVLAGEDYVGRASVPSGASTGQFEAVELRDGGSKFCGLGVKKAVHNVNEKIAQKIIGENVFDQAYIDYLLIKEDGTRNKENLGANAILGVSLAVARAAAEALNLPLYKYLGGVNARKMPVPMMNILNGGAHAANTIDFQEFMIMPIGVNSYKKGLQICCEIYHVLKMLLKKQQLSTAVGDEGGFAPNLPDTEAALDYIVEAITIAGYKPGEQIGIALDVAASEFYDSKTKLYHFQGESKMKGENITRTAEQMIEYYEDLIGKYPIVSIEDALDEEDWNGWELLTTRLGQDVQLVGDDLFVTNVERLEKGIKGHIGNAILVKVNQIGTLTESMNAIAMAQKSGYNAIVSHRSGETEDTFIADLAVAFCTGQIKTGAPCRAERTAKYNQLLRIEEQLSILGIYENPFSE